MPDFEELKLTVSLTDSASAGLANIRTQLVQLTQTAGQVQTALGNVATGTQQVGNAAQQAVPRITSQEKALKELTRSAEETGRGFAQMFLASRQGVAGLAQLALGFRQAQTGLQGISAGMGELGVASRLMVVGLGGVALGVAAVAASVAAYGISVFKFSQEMYTLSQTAKTLGLTFGQLKSMTEQNERYGISVGETTSQIAKMNDVLADLSLSGSKVRQQMLSLGISPQAIQDFQNLTDATDRYNKVREYEQQAYDDWLKRTGSKEIASVRAGGVGQLFGYRGDEYTREEQTKPSAADVALAAKIAEQSAEIAKHWREISEITTHIKDVFYSFGLESVKDALLSVLNVLEKGAGKPLTTDRPEFGPNAPHMTGPERLRRDRQRRREADPLFVPTSFGGAANDNSSGGRAQAIIKGGTYEALVEFYGFLQGGGSGKSGFQKASFGGSAGAAADGSHAGDSFRRAGATVTGDGGNNNGVIPSDESLDAKDKKWLSEGRVAPAETSAGTVDKAQGTTEAAPAADGSAASRATATGGKKGSDPATEKTASLDPKQVYGTSKTGSGSYQSDLDYLTEHGGHDTIGGKSVPAGTPGSYKQEDPEFAARLRAAGEAYKKETGQDPRYGELSRDEATQSVYYNRYLHGTGGIAAPPGRSRHQGGQAGDLPDSGFRRWLKSGHQSEFGLHFPVRGDAPHVQADPSYRGKPFADAAPKQTADALGKFDRSALNDQPLDRSSLNDNNRVNATSNFKIKATLPPGTDMNYSGTKLLEPDSTERQTDMGPSVNDTAQRYMRGGN